MKPRKGPLVMGDVRAGARTAPPRRQAPSRASTFCNIYEANAKVDLFIKKYQREISEWLKGPLDEKAFPMKFDEPVGRVLKRGAKKSVGGEWRHRLPRS